MKLLIDADACPVVEICLEQARKRGIPVTLYCDTSHILRHEDAETVVVSKGADSADFALVNALAPGDGRRKGDFLYPREGTETTASFYRRIIVALIFFIPARGRKRTRIINTDY